MRFKSYSFMFIFVFCFVLFLCTALQAELVKNYDSKTDETIINTKPTQIMELNPWKQPRLSLAIRYPGQEKPSPADLTKLEVKMSFISLSWNRKFHVSGVVQCFTNTGLVFQKKYDLDTNVRKKSIMETITVNVPYDEFEKCCCGNIKVKVKEGDQLIFKICKRDEIDKLGECIELKLHKIGQEDILRVRELLR